MACRRRRAVLSEEFGRAVAGGIQFPIVLTVLAIGELATCIVRRPGHMPQILGMLA